MILRRKLCFAVRLVRKIVGVAEQQEDLKTASQVIRLRPAQPALRLYSCRLFHPETPALVQTSAP